MSNAILAVAILFGGEPPAANLLPPFDTLAQGEISYYGKNVMEATWAYRLGRNQFPPCRQCVGMMAMIEPADMGRLVYIDWGSPKGIEGPLLVIDAGKEEHRAGLKTRKRIGEVSWPKAVERHMNRPLPAKILRIRPESACRVPRVKPVPC